MDTFNPSSFLYDLKDHMRIWVQSVHRTMNGSLDLGVPKGIHPVDGSVNSGVFNQFDKGNGSGVLVRIDAHGAIGTGAPYTWPAAGSVSIVHGLGRQPIGFHVVDADKDVRVFRPAAPNSSLIQLQPTDITASVTVYIF
jgi:hypothetical protein